MVFRLSTSRTGRSPGDAGGTYKETRPFLFRHGRACPDDLPPIVEAQTAGTRLIVMKKKRPALIPIGLCFALLCTAAAAPPEPEGYRTDDYRAAVPATLN